MDEKHVDRRGGLGSFKFFYKIIISRNKNILFQIQIPDVDNIWEELCPGYVGKRVSEPEPDPCAVPPVGLGHVDVVRAHRFPELK